MDTKNKNSKDIASILADKFVLKNKLGNGSFGQLYSAVLKENGTIIAIKVEKKFCNQITTLVKETKILGDLQGIRGFPTLYGYGKELNFNYMAIELLGQDLEKLLVTCHNKLSLKTSLLLLDQMLTRIEALHQKGFLHRDIKPENFCMNKDNRGDLYIIDFGLTRSYKDTHGAHIPMVEKKGLVGTARYASINSHLGFEQSRRDDLESIGYTIIYLLKGKLPWQDIKTVDKNEKYTLIADIKMTTPINLLCKDLPAEFITYLTYVKNLDFTDNPDYKYLKGLFRALFLKSGFSFDYEYDWLKPAPKQVLSSLDGVSDKYSKGVARVEAKQVQDDRNLERKNEFKISQLPKFESAFEIPRVKDPKESRSPAYKVVINAGGVSAGDVDLNNQRLSKRPDNYQFRVNTNLLTGRSTNAVKAGDSGKPDSGHSDKNISIFSISSSKQLNLSKSRLEDDDIPMEITLVTAPSAKILETKPLATKTKDSYYVAIDASGLLPPGVRSNPRKRTFLRAQSDLEKKVETMKGKLPLVGVQPQKVFKQGNFVIEQDLNLHRREYG